MWDLSTAFQIQIQITKWWVSISLFGGVTHFGSLILEKCLSVVKSFSQFGYYITIENIQVDKFSNSVSDHKMVGFHFSFWWKIHLNREYYCYPLKMSVHQKHTKYIPIFCKKSPYYNRYFKTNVLQM